MPTTAINKNDETSPPTKTKEKEDKTSIIPYSLKNKKTNTKLPISILNPLINSLSPSKRSNGARLVSIKLRTSQTPLQQKSSSVLSASSIFSIKVLPALKRTKNTKISATSKESLCSIPRKLPSLENPLVLLQPVKITE